MIATWTSDLPAVILADGFQLSMADGRIKAGPDTGPGKVRRRFSRSPRFVQCQSLATEMELARFEQFWAEDTIEGTVPFIIANPIRNNKPLTTADGTPLTKRSSTPEGDGEPLLVSAHWLVMFGDDTPTISVASGLLYSIQYPLVIMP